MPVPSLVITARVPTIWALTMIGAILDRERRRRACSGAGSGLLLDVDQSRGAGDHDGVVAVAWCGVAEEIT